MKNTKARRGIKYRRRLAFALAFTVLSSLLSGSVFAAPSSSSEYLCGHVHNGECGYVRGSAGSPCTHTHDDTCGYVEAAPCTYVHTHDGLCGYCEGSPCTYTHTHDELCGFIAETGEGCTDTHAHDEACGYVPASPCTDVHVHDETCGYAEGAPCAHVHDEKCGYKDSVTAVPCNHFCYIIAFSDYTRTYEAPAGAAYDAICAALPRTLSANLSCAADTVDVPVTWSCADFTGEAGTYIFSAAINAAHCAYTPVDINESALPSITVTLPEAPPTPEPTPETSPSPTASPSPTPESSPETSPTPSPSPIPTSEPSPSPTPALPTTLTSGAVTLTGVLPEGAYLVVTEVPVADAEELLGETDTNTVVLFAYDIKIMLPGALDEETGERGEPTEYQPGAENPVTVTISPPKPIEAPTVEVLHIAENADTGEKTPQSVATVTPTGNTVEFEAEGFSVYVVTMTATNYTVSFDYDDPSLGIEYSTDGSVFTPLTSDVTVAVGTVLYFKVTGGSVMVYRDDNSTPMMADANSVYTVDSITANTMITIIDGSNVTFNVGKGPIVIGGDDGSGGRNYTGYDSIGALLTGVHAPGNIYTITGSTGSPDSGGGNNVTLTGEGDFNVVLSDVTIYTGTPGGPYVGEGRCAPVSTSGVTGAGNINITLVGTNTLANVSENPSNSYAALEKTYNDSTLIINGPGTLYATGGADSAGIGSSDYIYQGTKNITINSGTINATTKGSQGAGIGSGNNLPAENIRIYGGNITATGFDNGAGIGGSGSATFTANTGEVYIYGGTINATSNGNGAGIGGGGSGTGVEAKGGDGEVYIYGGTITADSIGGGDGGNSGGAATVTISGGKVTTVGNIGGGSGSTGGTATVNISGGTVVTPHISGGKNSDGTYKDATVSIAAASVNIADRSNINSVTGPDPNGGMPIVVYCQTIDVNELDGFTGGSGDIIIQSADLSDGHTYPLKDVYSDTAGMLYFWLPTEYHVTGLIINEVDYTVTDNAQTQIATITHDSSTVGSTLGAALNYGTPTAYKWQISDNGIDNWTDIATLATYIVSSSDVGKYIRVVVSVNSQDVISGSLRITDTPYARVVYTSLTAGSTLTAQLLNGDATTYQWQRYDSVNITWADISDAVNSTYQVPDSDLGKQLRVIIGDGTSSYTSSFVYIYSPSFTITIPASINAAATGSFSIAGVLSHFTSSQSVTVSYSSGNELALTGAETNTLSYSLRTQGDTYIPSGGTVATFSGDGSSTVPIYYTISGIPIYSGTYSDTLTFTVTFITGS